MPLMAWRTTPPGPYQIDPSIIAWVAKSIFPADIPSTILPKPCRNGAERGASITARATYEQDTISPKPVMPVSVCT